MAAKILALHSLLIQSIFDLLFRCLVFHLKNLQFSVIILINDYVMSLLNDDTEFPQLYVNLPSHIWHLKLSAIF